MANKMLVIYCLLILKLVSTPALAVRVEEILPDGLLAHAEYQAGDPDRPAVLLLHGFLTVHTFSLIQNISNELYDNGFSVLTPTLSLGISKRKTTLDCDALHLHSMDNDLAEINWWANWLINKGHKEIILVGHSSGALQMLHFANRYPNQAFKQYIAISLISLERLNEPSFVDSLNRARNMHAQNDDGIQNFTLAYCINNYAAPAKEYLSYANWSSKDILKSLRKLKIERHIIMGEDDLQIYPGWIQDLSGSGIPLEIITGANHFFSDGTEFELYEKLLDIINPRDSSTP